MMASAKPKGDCGVNRIFHLPSHFGAGGIFASKEAGFSWKSLPNKKILQRYTRSSVAS
jgi:hypothetical protein